MHITITPIFAAILALIFVGLSMRVAGFRRREKIAVGDGGNAMLQRAIRAHGNFIEYVPIALLILAFLEMRNVGIYVMIILGALLLVGRCSHAYGISNPDETYTFRIVGIILTFIVIGVGSLWLLLTYL
ncbi:MAPEG family protein [Sneathiella sp.]|uniref:MAPEG family protein n=1 Tax=Sneathiella sp. TaxID=1964365 RepID=UPI00356895C6